MGLVIRKEQMAAFQKMVDENAARRIARHLQAEHAAAVQGITDEHLLRMVLHGMDRARTHGLEDEPSLACFVGLMFEIAPDFDEQPTIARVLSDRTIPPEYRIDELFEVTTDADWGQAERETNVKSWRSNRTLAV